MAITKATLLAEIAEDLTDYGKFSVDEGGFLDRKLTEAMQDVVAKPWKFLLKHATVTTAQGNLGPYDLPLDFDSLPVVKRLGDVYAYDTYASPPPIGDGPFGRKYPVYVNEATGELYFRFDPGTGTKTLTYLSKMESVESWPDEPWLTKILNHRTRFYALQPTEDFANQAKTEFDLSEKLINDGYRKELRSNSRPAVRELLGTGGFPSYRNLQGLK